nr:thyrotropin receptor-like [Biomphalaria glabrata]
MIRILKAGPHSLRLELIKRWPDGNKQRGNGGLSWFCLLVSRSQVQYLMLWREQLSPNTKSLLITDCHSLLNIGPGVFGQFQNLNTLRILKSGLTSVPDFSRFETKVKALDHTMYEIDLTANKIQSIKTGQFSKVKTYILRLESNMLTRIEDKAFYGAVIKRFICRNNFYLSHLEDLAFSGIKDFHVLDLSKSRITHLPTDGLIDIRELVLEDTPTLKKFPSVFKFSEIDTARLTYKHHCCAFRLPHLQDESSSVDLTGRSSACSSQMTTPSFTSSSDTSTAFSTSADFRIRRDVSIFSSIRQLISLGWGAFGNSRSGDAETKNNFQGKGGSGDHGFILFGEHQDFGPIITSSTSVPVGITTRSSVGWHETPKPHNDTKWFSCGNFTTPKDYSEVVCTPQPNAFNPCEDLMGYSWLRVFVWFVLLAALGGNLVVIVVLLTARSKLTVPKFLMCNLSFADFLMGLYLLLIASVDVHFLGDYFTHAVSWQNDGGCQVAGFITVFASELSVFVLTVITMERWYAISQAIHVNKRLRMRQATCLMFAGWGYASSMAILPLLGVSGYGAVSICLPMEARDLWDIIYIIGLLLFNGVAFVVICGCYISMFLKVRASENMERRNDVTIAKRMAILVLTNFICWAPIAFFGLTASFGLPLIDITNSKILLVFFYPFNSCANPFLYAILTKQFRKDFFILLGRYGICTDRANKYKGTSMTRSYSNSRHNGLQLNVTHNTPTDTSILSQYRKGSRGSFSQNGTPPHGSRGSFPKVTPQSTPQETPTTSPKVVNSPCKDGLGRMFSFTMSIDSSKGSKNERKLSTVIETSHTSDGPSDDGCGTCTAVSCNGSGDRVLEARDSLRDLFDGKPHGRVRSASEYIVIFKASPQSHLQQSQQPLSSLPDKRRGSQRSDNLERQLSRDALRNSSNTLSSYISDGSSRFDSDSDVRLFERRQSPASFITTASLDKRDSGISDMYPVSAANYIGRNRKSQDSGSIAETEALLNKRNNLSGLKKNGTFETAEHKCKYSLMNNRFSADSIDEEDAYVNLEPRKRRPVGSRAVQGEDGGAYSTDGDDTEDDVKLRQSLLNKC